MRRMICCALGFMLAGCGVGRDSILFATRTNLAIDLDAVPVTTDIGYKRDELVLAPVDAGGNVLPVMTTVGVRANPLDFGANHSFATGDAALVLSRFLLTDARPAEVESIPTDPADLHALIGDGSIASSDLQRYYFGTNTVLGLGVQWNAAFVPQSIAVGYKRKELALVPLGTTTATAADGSAEPRLTVASLIATGHAGATVAGGNDATALVGQTFATGQAATNLAGHPEVRRAVGPSVVPKFNDAVIAKIAAGERLNAARVSVKDTQAAIVSSVVARYAATTDDTLRGRILAAAAANGVTKLSATAKPRPTATEVDKRLTALTTGEAGDTERLKAIDAVR